MDYIVFTTTFTVIIVVCSLKSMCVPSFIIIGYMAILCPYHNVMPEAVYCYYKNYIV